MRSQRYIDMGHLKELLGQGMKRIMGGGIRIGDLEEDKR